MAIASPAMTVLTLEMFPRVKGLASSLQNFVFLIIFGLISGLIVPLLFESAFRLALASVVGVAVSMLCWWLGSRKESDHPILTDEEQPLAEEVPHF